MQKNTQPPSSIDEKDRIKYRTWWRNLSDDWKKAFNHTLFQRGEVATDLSDEELHIIWQAEALRFAGPRALYPNMSFEIGNLDGVKDLFRLKTLAIVDNNISTLRPISNLKYLEGLFVFNNQLTNLEGVENLKNLKQFYFQDNVVTSLEPLKKLTHLEEIYACRNQLKSLKGLGKKHAKRLTLFRILPNDKLSRKEIIQFEFKTDIHCEKG